MKATQFNVVVIGGSGFWTEINHIPNILAIQKKTALLKVIGICDLNDPYAMPLQDRKNLHHLLRIDKPTWVRAKNSEDINSEGLTTLHADKHIDLLIIACNPTMHFLYAMWALEHGISVVCDKPLIDVTNAASDPEAASKIVENYSKLVEAYKEAKRKKSYLTFSLLLRRRTLPAFNAVEEHLNQVWSNYRAGINHLNILNHNGIYKYPDEMQGSGAHDFSAGVGALSHSSYHYIDLFNRYLSAAKGEIAYIVPTLTNIFRVSDYLTAESFEVLRSVNKHGPKNSNQTLPKEVLACELDFAFHLDFYRKDGVPIGDGNFISNHISFSPRTRDYVHDITEPAQFKDGGRISHLYVDIHQSGLQNLQIIKNDIAFQGPSIIFRSRTHPAIKDMVDLETIYFDDAYNKTEFHLKDMLEMVIEAIMEKRPVMNDAIIDICDDEQNLQLFAKFYELIAREYSGINVPSSEADRIEIV